MVECKFFVSTDRAGGYGVGYSLRSREKMELDALNRHAGCAVFPVVSWLPQALMLPLPPVSAKEVSAAD